MHKQQSELLVGKQPLLQHRLPLGQQALAAAATGGPAACRRPCAASAAPPQCAGPHQLSLQRRRTQSCSTAPRCPLLLALRVLPLPRCLQVEARPPCHQGAPGAWQRCGSHPAPPARQYSQRHRPGRPAPSCSTRRGGGGISAGAADCGRDAHQQGLTAQPPRGRSPPPAPPPRRLAGTAGAAPAGWTARCAPHAAGAAAAAPPARRGAAWAGSCGGGPELLRGCRCSEGRRRGGGKLERSGALAGPPAVWRVDSIVRRRLEVQSNAQRAVLAAGAAAPARRARRRATRGAGRPPCSSCAPVRHLQPATEDCCTPRCVRRSFQGNFCATGGCAAAGVPAAPAPSPPAPASLFPRMQPLSPKPTR